MLHGNFSVEADGDPALQQHLDLGRRFLILGRVRNDSYLYTSFMRCDERPRDRQGCECVGGDQNSCIVASTRANLIDRMDHPRVRAALGRKAAVPRCARFERVLLGYTLLAFSLVFRASEVADTLRSASEQTFYRTQKRVQTLRLRGHP